MSTQFGTCETYLLVQPPRIMVPIAPVPTTPVGKIFALLVFVAVPLAPVPTTVPCVNITVGVGASKAPRALIPVAQTTTTKGACL